jgi:tetratricopeptide (TPR) repeat protein
MAGNITTSAELFHRFHTCEMHVKQGKIATCLIAFKQIIDSINIVPFTDKEKKEFNESVAAFLKNLSGHKKFKEIFGEVSFGDTDLKTNLEFMKSMISAQEEEIVQKVEKDEEAAAAQRMDMEKMEQKKKEEMQHKIDEAIKLIDENNLTQAMEIIGGIEELSDAVILHFNDKGIGLREAKNFEEAAKCFSQALAVSPGDENLHYNIGRAYYEQDQPGKAEDYLAKALKINPDFAEGKLFYDYLLKLKEAQTNSAGDGNKKRSGGFFQKLFSFKKWNFSTART